MGKEQTGVHTQDTQITMLITTTGILILSTHQITLFMIKQLKNAINYPCSR